MTELEERGERLARATDALRAPAGFADALMARLPPPSGSLEVMRRAGPFALAAAVLAAAASVAFAVNLDHKLDDDAIANVSLVEPLE